MRLLCLINWFRDHIPKLSHKLNGITEKLKEDLKFTWSEEDTEQIYKIVQDIKTNILLHHPDLSKPFTLSTDASDEGLGAIFEQEEKIVGLYSHKLLKDERNYTTTEKELLAIIRALQHF